MIGLHLRPISPVKRMRVSFSGSLGLGLTVTFTKEDPGIEPPSKNSTGTPEEISNVSNSYTGYYLKDILKKR